MSNVDLIRAINAAHVAGKQLNVKLVSTSGIRNVYQGYDRQFRVAFYGRLGERIVPFRAADVALTEVE